MLHITDFAGEYKRKRGEKRKREDEKPNLLLSLAVANAYLLVGGTVATFAAIWLIFIITLIYIWVVA